MSGYTRNAVYTVVKTAIQSSYPNAYFTSRFVAKPASFPACYIHEIDRDRPIENIHLDFSDVQWESVFEIQVVSNNATAAASEAYAIMDLARAAFSSLYYREFSETNIDGGTQFKIIGRFRRIIGGGDVMPNNDEDNE